MTTPNAELAYRVLDQIDAHPESWSQGTWDCGTAACFAGWAVRLSGCKSLDQDSDTVVISGPEPLVGMPVSLAAEWVLGHKCCNDDAYGEDLFAPNNTREDLGRLVAEFFGPRPERAS